MLTDHKIFFSSPAPPGEHQFKHPHGIFEVAVGHKRIFSFQFQCIAYTVYVYWTNIPSSILPAQLIT